MPFWFWLMFWLILVFTPLILGICNYVPWKGVIVCEVVMFSPVLVFFALLVLFMIPSGRIDTDYIREMYLP